MKKLFVMFLLAVAAESAWALSAAPRAGGGGGGGGGNTQPLALAVSSPNGGERWMLGSYHYVNWNQAPGGTTLAYLETFDLATGQFIEVGQMAVNYNQDGSMSWYGDLVGGGYPTAAQGYYVRLDLYDWQENFLLSDRSNASFEILPFDFVSITLLANGNKSIQIAPGGQVVTLSWTSVNTDSVTVNYTNGLGSGYVDNLPPNGTVDIFIQEPASEWGGTISAEAISQYGYRYAWAAIQPAQLAVLSPATGDVVTESDQMTVIWNFAQKELADGERIFDDYRIYLGNQLFGDPIYLGTAAKTETQASITLTSGAAKYFLDACSQQYTPAQARANFYVRVEARKVVYQFDAKAGATIATNQIASAANSGTFYVYAVIPPAPAPLPPQIMMFSGPNKLKVGEAGNWKLGAIATPGATVDGVTLWANGMTQDSSGVLFKETSPGKYEGSADCRYMQAGTFQLLFYVTDESSGLFTAIASEVTVEEDSSDGSSGQVEDLVIYYKTKKPSVSFKSKPNGRGTKMNMMAYFFGGLDIKTTEDEKTGVRRIGISAKDVPTINLKF